MVWHPQTITGPDHFNNIYYSTPNHPTPLSSKIKLNQTAYIISTKLDQSTSEPTVSTHLRIHSFNPTQPSLNGRSKHINVPCEFFFRKKRKHTVNSFRRKAQLQPVISIESNENSRSLTTRKTEKGEPRIHAPTADSNYDTKRSTNKGCSQEFTSFNLQTLANNSMS